MLTIAFLLVLASGCPALASDSGQPKNVLVLYSFSDRGLFDPLDNLKAAIRSRANAPVNFYVHYMEAQGLEDPSYDVNLSEILRSQYKGVKFDLVITAVYTALQFAVRHRDEMFPGAPVIFSYVHASRVDGKQLPPGVTGVTTSVGVRETLELAFRLHPGTQNLAVVAGTAEFERFWRAAVRKEFGLYADKTKLIEIVGLSNTEILKQVAALPTHTVVLFLVMPRDSTQPEVGLYDTAAAIGQRFPEYCIFKNFCVGHGGIGGSYPDYGEQTAKTAEIASRLLSGEKAENIPVVHDSGTRVNVDWRELVQWNIPESALPPGTIVLYRQPTVWDRYKKYIIAGVAVIILQALLIAGLLWQRARRRKTELTLRESEKRFQVMADTTPSLVWMCDPEGNVVYLNDRRIRFTGRDPKGGFGDAWTSFIHPDDREGVQIANRRALEQKGHYSKEYRLRRQDGEYRWMLDVAAPRINGDGRFAGFVGAAVDVTDQKLAQEALEKVSGKLIEAQEAERDRIARDLHDDFSQRLAIQCIELTQLRNDLPESEVEARAEALEMLKGLKELSADMRSLSHELHSSRLELVGLVPALGGLCEEVTMKYKIDIQFTEHEVPVELRKDIGLCLFRVAQEALTNAVKHSGAACVQLDLAGGLDSVKLHISDDGNGFDSSLKSEGAGIGLIGMRERIRLVRGRLTVHSELNRGTEILAEVPFVAAVDAEHTVTHVEEALES